MLLTTTGYVIIISLMLIYFIIEANTDHNRYEQWKEIDNANKRR